MTRSYLGGRTVLYLGLFLAASACGGSEFRSGSDGAGGSPDSSADSGGSGGSRGSTSDASSSSSSASSSSGGRASSTSTGSGGNSAASGGTTSSSGGGSDGGASTGGSGGSGGSTVRGQCEVADDCLAVADFGDACYSEGCSLPVAAALADLERDTCLVPWESRGEGRPASCDPPDSLEPCPESCAVPPKCITVGCHSSQCQLELGYDDDTCGGTSGSGGSAGSGGAPSGDGSGGTGGVAADCDVLNEARQTFLNEAVTCSPEIDVPQCTGAVTVPDQCGCPVLVNDYDEASVIAAQAAYDQWVEAGCGPYPCGAECFYGETGDCSEESSTCAWNALE